MPTIRLKVSDSVYANLMWLLRKFGKDEVQILEEDTAFPAAQKELQTDLAAAETPGTNTLSLDELDNHLEATIRRHEG